MSFHTLEDAYVTVVLERTKTGAPGLAGGGTGRPNRAAIRQPDGTCTALAKATRLQVRSGATIELHTGGGGGYGPPQERKLYTIRHDLREGYVTEDHVRRHYPHALAGG
jgi:N-methylhydantoinase B